MTFVGTSGYSFRDWVGPFYPEGLAGRDMLAFYARQFDTVELNFTYYRIPEAPMMARIAEAVPDSFRFFVKANEATTHRRDRAAAPSFLEAIEPLRASGKLAGLLAQFPYSFKNQEGSRRYLFELREDFSAENVVVEFRHRGWVREPIFDLLERLRMGFCCVDEPDLPGLLPRLARATSDTAYVRFHSRDAGKWFSGDAQQRYHYLYSPEELQEWLPRAQALVHDPKVANLFVFFNNCHAGHAAANALQFQKMLQEAGLLS
ncbi:MAG: DUF72 domain-containing protein [Planctomycetes bacterium]|nr:DUF72 domain-containing protein [Planctomycetota bacterium]